MSLGKLKTGLSIYLKDYHGTKYYMCLIAAWSISKVKNVDIAYDIVKLYV